jgi:hypothetical protein
LGATKRWPCCWKIAAQVLSAELNALHATFELASRLQLDRTSVPPAVRLASVGARLPPVLPVSANCSPPLNRKTG